MDESCTCQVYTSTHDFPLNANFYKPKRNHELFTLCHPHILQRRKQTITTNMGSFIWFHANQLRFGLTFELHIIFCHWKKNLSVLVFFIQYQYFTVSDFWKILLIMLCYANKNSIKIAGEILAKGTVKLTKQVKNFF